MNFYVTLSELHCRNETMKIIEIAYIGDLFQMSENTSGVPLELNNRIEKTARLR